MARRYSVVGAEAGTVAGSMNTRCHISNHNSDHRSSTGPGQLAAKSGAATCRRGLQGLADGNHQSHQTCRLQGFAWECGPVRGDRFGVSGPYWI